MNKKNSIHLGVAIIVKNTIQIQYDSVYLY